MKPSSHNVADGLNRVRTRNANTLLSADLLGAKRM